MSFSIVSQPSEKTGLPLLSLRFSLYCASTRKPTELTAGFFRYNSNISWSVCRIRSTSAWAFIFSFISKATYCLLLRLLFLCITPPRFPLLGILRNGDSLVLFLRELVDLVIKLLFFTELLSTPIECSRILSGLGGELTCSSTRFLISYSFTLFTI